MKDKPLARLTWEYGRGWHDPLGSATPAKKVCEICSASAESERALIIHKLQIHPEISLSGKENEKTARWKEKTETKASLNEPYQDRLIPG